MKFSLKYIPLLGSVFYYLFRNSNKIKSFVKDNDKMLISHTKRNIFYRSKVLKLSHKHLKMVFFSEGIEKTKDMQVLFAPNHQAFADAVTMLNTSDRAIGFIAKKETSSLPVLIQNCMDSVGNVLIDRSNLRSEVLSFKTLTALLENNKDLSYVIFPEGTRSKAPDFNLGQMHPGSFRVATRLELPIVPVCLYGGERLLNPRFHLKKYPIQVCFLDPIMPEEYNKLTPNEIADKVHDSIEKKLVEFKKLDLKYLQILNNYSDKKMEKIKQIYSNQITK